MAEQHEGRDEERDGARDTEGERWRERETGREMKGERRRERDGGRGDTRAPHAGDVSCTGTERAARLTCRDENKSRTAPRCARPARSISLPRSPRLGEGLTGLAGSGSPHLLHSPGCEGAPLLSASARGARGERWREREVTGGARQMEELGEGYE
ncbi:unnamed protein product [Lampetra fluviatilis]